MTALLWNLSSLSRHLMQQWVIQAGWSTLRCSRDKTVIWWFGIRQTVPQLLETATLGTGVSRTRWTKSIFSDVCGPPGCVVGPWTKKGLKWDSLADLIWADGLLSLKEPYNWDRVQMSRWGLRVLLKGPRFTKLESELWRFWSVTEHWATTMPTK